MMENLEKYEELKYEQNAKFKQHPDFPNDFVFLDDDREITVNSCSFA